MAIDVKNLVDTGLAVSREALNKAGNAARDLGDKSVLRLELAQLEKKLAKNYESLGIQVSEAFATRKKDSLSASDAEISGFLHETARLTAEIGRRNGLLKSKPE
ncbi:MAG: hypothetical protein LBS64_06575 [Spirochaetaceae bacterium]|jgi:hypothetical protein|nr:hypothetical protein [Spirochaetaceae bacterium]